MKHLNSNQFTTAETIHSATKAKTRFAAVLQTGIPIHEEGYPWDEYYTPEPGDVFVHCHRDDDEYRSTIPMGWFINRRGECIDVSGNHPVRIDYDPSLGGCGVRYLPISEEGSGKPREEYFVGDVTYEIFAHGFSDSDVIVTVPEEDIDI